MMLSTTNRLYDAMRSAAERMERRGDRLNAEKLQELMAKLEAEELEIAFCGHFSAGKSTLINRLCGYPLLPSSPIPTSANIVTIRQGEKPEAVILQRGGDRKTVPIDQLEAYCRNSEEIEEVAIRYPWNGLDARLVLMDTPGIDSTDEAHHLATASVMHRADAVFYVMDYNHVQSEINFTFSKQLADRGKPVYLIVNQIDKHREQELSFPQYRASVEEAFAVWGMRPAGFFFISLKDERHPCNEWPHLVRFIRRLPEHADVLKPHNAHHSALALIEEHGKRLEQEQADTKETLAERIASAEIGEQLERRAALRLRLQQLARMPEQLQEEAKAELAKLADNANLMPAPTRELAAAVLESRQPGFKTGWLRAAAKTEAERERRLQAFLTDFTDQVNVHLQAHLIRLFEQTAKNMKLDVNAWDERFRGLTPPITAELVLGMIPPGAGATGEAVLNYSNRLAAEVKGRVRRAGSELLSELAAACRERLQAELQDGERELAELEQELAAYEELQRLERETAEHVQALKALIVEADVDVAHAFPAPSKEEAAQGMESAASVKVDAGRTNAPSETPNSAASRIAAAREPRRETAAWKQELEAGLKETSARLFEAVRLIEDIPALKPTARSLREKAERLRENRYAVALFGAFSAGKSSFANALLGVRAMPVSPNPTTAAIIRVVPPVSGWEHGTAKVTIKERSALEEEVLYSLEQLGMQADSLEAGLRLIPQIVPGEVSPKGRPHYAFLRAVLQGWERESGHLGQALRTDMELYAEYAAQESRSCFVRDIELYLSCPMTDAGLTLVDTPGADSINARHTGVAFNYIKNADAILFVTYYNHAFSQADREFLNQLGRVKDSFELDKMFFVVNAADLAASGEELAGVLRHVEDNLLTHGIRHPRLFPVSSMLAVEAKLEHDEAKLLTSGIEAFERRFYPFIYEELNALILEAAKRDIRRAAASLSRWIDHAQRDADQQRKLKQALEEAYAQAVPMLTHAVTPREQEAVKRETEELVFYVRQRIGIRFGEFYQLSFNPSVLGTNTAPAQALADAWNELVRLISYDLSQEMLATTLRIEKHLKTMLREYRERKTAEIRGILPEFTAPGEDAAVRSSTPEVEERLPIDRPETKWLLQQFRNQKAFFEGDGSKKLREQLELRFTAAVARYAEGHIERFVSHYTEVYAGWQKEEAARLRAGLEEFVKGGLAALEQEADLDDLRRRKRELEALESAV
jgi:small GTP-binding protein